jgi:hypothetical protein
MSSGMSPDAQCSRAQLGRDIQSPPFRTAQSAVPIRPVHIARCGAYEWVHPSEGRSPPARPSRLLHDMALDMADAHALLHSL